MARLLHGKPIADEVAAALRERIERLAASGRGPSLVLITTRPDAASRLYMDRLKRTGARLGIEVVVREVSGERSLHDVIDEANRDEMVHGITLLSPLPPEIDSGVAVERIDPRKDVDGLHPYNAGRLAMGRPVFIPATAESILRLLHASGTKLEGASAVVVGRSPAVGRPAALLLMRENATVTLAHSGTHHLAELTRAAEILVVGVGRPGLITADMVRQGAIVVDAGINATPDGVVGDVDLPSVSTIASAVTPVPGGVGSLTTVLLLASTVRAAEFPR